LTFDTTEDKRLNESDEQRKAWLSWGPYLSERQWGTVREDYSPGGTAWDYFPHDHARSRAYRWGEDGIAGISDSDQRLCFGLSLWNGRDPILKERMFGLTNDQGNHGEDVKELYFYQDSTPSHSYMKMLYKYPHSEFPYKDLIDENAHRKATDSSAPEYELIDTGVFDNGDYFDVEVEYAKRTETDILVRISVTNNAQEDRKIWLLPTLWFRNNWAWDSDTPKPALIGEGNSTVSVTHNDPDLNGFRFICPDADKIVFCENETNAARVFGSASSTLYPKDGINDHIVNGAATISPDSTGTKASAVYQRIIKAGQTTSVTLRLAYDKKATSLGKTPTTVFDTRIKETDEFYQKRLPATTSADRKNIYRQALAGMMWSKQYFYYNVSEWMNGDEMPPPSERKNGRNKEWSHFYARDIISMPDAWEYPWFASWDLSFHTVALARADLRFAKDQVLLLCQEWYMHPNGQVPAYEWAFDDVNPPVQAWAGLQIIQYEYETFGRYDFEFCENLFDHCLLYFSWWVNRKDAEGNNLFQGGFLGLDNIAVFDRSAGYLPGGGRLYQSDGTTWVSFFALQMMELAFNLSEKSDSYLNFAGKFFQHFTIIAEAMEHLSNESDGKVSLWDNTEGLFFDVLHTEDNFIPLKVRSLVSLIPLIAAMPLKLEKLNRESSGIFEDRIKWFKSKLDGMVGSVLEPSATDPSISLLSLLSKDKLQRIMGPFLDKDEFLSDYGIRSVSRRHLQEPFEIEIENQIHRVEYQPAESHSGMFGGNSNWRGPIWMPMNYILVDSLRIYAKNYGDDLKFAYPTGSENMLTLNEIADHISNNLISIFELDKNGRRPVYGGTEVFQSNPEWLKNILFYEYFHGDNGAGIGAAHQTGWTGLVAVLIEQQAKTQAKDI
jgi:hypothetical protein